MIPYRFRILVRWINWRVRKQAEHSSWHAPFRDVWAQLWQRSLEARVRPWVKSIDRDGEFLVIRFHQLEDPLWWPKQVRLHDLWVVADEQFDPRHWHRYEVGGTEVAPDDVVMDCGASEGLFALTIVRRCRHIHLIEPSPLYRAALQRTFAKFGNVSIHAVGVGDTADRMSFRDSGVTSGFDASAGAGVDVPIVTADDHFAALELKPTYLKADIEGWELPMLQGAARLLATTVKRVAITVYHTPKNDYREITAFLAKLNPGFEFHHAGVAVDLNPAGRPVPIVLHVNLATVSPTLRKK